ncbi:MAG: Rne/Rng family ribonuclease, partial [Halanaerobiaceae bacterium]
MSRQIIINAGIREKRAAIIEDNSLDDMLFERDTYEQIARNIYRARVKDVLPGMQAAFVDIGIEKNAFLHISDTFPLLSSSQFRKWKKNQLGIQHIVQPGQEIMVQVIKEPIGSKGPKVTCKVTLPGRYFVYLPYEKKTGISRRITDQKERNRLKQIAREFTNNNGVIVRTNAAGKNRKTLIHDYRYLNRVWGDVKNRYHNSRAPALVYRDVELMKLIVRDYLSPDIDKVVVDDKKAYNSLLHLADIIVPDLKNKINLYQKSIPIFDYYGIEKELSRVLQRKVWLKSGGYVIFDTTEALVSIDVNTGKYIGKKNLQETVYKT